MPQQITVTLAQHVYAVWLILSAAFYIVILAFNFLINSQVTEVKAAEAIVLTFSLKYSPTVLFFCFMVPFSHSVLMQ